ncbi:hypothetical protein [Staphylococcus kloosii]|jgi:hypothetical protein|uniref:hypothetical protein n=1 Tax=Staphylococcus kloosii TaxID=29384 RepID=UPI00189F8991|nr:hypothetical protein [Staphylococcus kloosii]MBF7023650.1 hypothetical protein [Staphylococcus kloosii]
MAKTKQLKTNDDSIKKFSSIYKKVENSQKLTREKKRIESELKSISAKINHFSANGKFLEAAQQRQQQSKYESELLSLEETRKQSPEIATVEELQEFNELANEERNQLRRDLKSIGNEIMDDLNILNGKIQKYVETKNELNRRTSKVQYVNNELHDTGNVYNLYNTNHKDYTVHDSSIYTSNDFAHTLKDNFDTIENSEALKYITGKKAW